MQFIYTKQRISFNPIPSQISIVWDSDAKRAIDRFNFHSGSINDIRWIAKDEFASCSTDGAVYICKLGMETFYRQLQNNVNLITTFSFSYNDNILAIQKSITSLQWSQFDSRLAFASLDGHVKVGHFISICLF